MSSIRILGASLIALIAGTAAAAAADMPYNPPPAQPGAYSPAPAWSWTGPYAGLTGGYGWGSGTSPAGGITADDWMGGVYTGYNFQPSSNFVLGVEGDYLFGGQNGTNAGGFGVSNPWDATVRLRAGVPIDRFLIYGTGGLAIGDVKASEPGFSNTDTKIGWTVGAGIEAALTQNVTARVEYRHTDLGSTPTGGGNSLGYTSDDVLLGVGMKF